MQEHEQSANTREQAVAREEPGVQEHNQHQTVSSSKRGAGGARKRATIQHQTVLARDSLQETPSERLILLARDSSSSQETPCDRLLASPETPCKRLLLLARDSSQETPCIGLLTRDSSRETPRKGLLARDLLQETLARDSMLLARSILQGVSRKIL